MFERMAISLATRRRTHVCRGRAHACACEHEPAAATSTSRRRDAAAFLAALAAATLLGAYVPAATDAAAHTAATVSVVRLLAARIATVKQRDGGVPVLLPTTMPLDRPDYTASSASPGRYRLEIDGAEPCGGANVCLFALFTGVRGGRRYGSPLRLSHGIRGGYADIQCGAACSPASLDWVENGVLYAIEANPSGEYHPGAPPDTVRAAFVAAADQAIDAGPR
jgi:hypothetical protein